MPQSPTRRGQGSRPAPWREGTLVLSPHPDDAAFSLGGAIAAGLLPTPITLLTVFGRSTFTQATGPHGDVSVVTQQRRAEDQAYAERHGLRWVWLGLDEAVLRLGWKNIFRVDPAPPDGLSSLVERARQLDAALVLAPLGLGQHADHVLLRDLAREIAGTSELAFYEDLPYAAGLSADTISAQAKAFDATLQPTDLCLDAAAVAAKRRDIECYASQVNLWLRRSLKRHARSGRERLWSQAALALGLPDA